MVAKIALHVLLTVLFSFSAKAQPILIGESEHMAFSVDEVASGLGVPWGMTFLDDSRLIVTEREGKVKVLDTLSGKLTEISGVPGVFHGGQGGLLDVAVKKGYGPDDWIYFTYSKSINGQGATCLARARLEGSLLVDWQDMLVTRSVTDTGHHFGSRIAFDGHGHLFFTIGDRGERPNGQDLATHAGSVLRLNLDGTVPPDNPFAGGGGLAEIWSYGHRNPQGIAYDYTLQRLWVNEHGPRGGDEINLIEPGGNYGWPVVSHGKEYWGPVNVGEGTSRPDMKDPVKVYIPSIAPGSLLFYSGAAFPQWRGNLFSGALKLQHLNRVVLDGTRAIQEERLLGQLGERIRGLAVNSRGWLYLSTDSGRILALRPSAAD